MGRFSGILGIILILGLAYLMSNNRKAINLRVVLSGMGLQLALALFILKTEIGQNIFNVIAKFITRILDFANAGAEFVFGGLVRRELLLPIFGDKYWFLFMFKIMPTIIFVAVLVSIAYHIGLMQRIVSVFAKGMKLIMNVSGSEALSNVSSAFVGQVEAQILIKPYISGMTMSELLASMTGSMACIAYGIAIQEVVIYNLKEGIFYSKLFCSDGEKVQEIDARTSDAIAMAVRFNCPIYTYEFILSQAGVLLDDDNALIEEPKKEKEKKTSTTKTPAKEGEYTSMTTEELKESLMRAIDEEAYETASKIRDELNKRKKSS